jgi:hypothetical protein
MANEKNVFYINCIMIVFVVRTEFCTLIDMWKVDENIYDCNNLNSLSVFGECAMWFPTVKITAHIQNTCVFTVALIHNFTEVYVNIFLSICVKYRDINFEFTNFVCLFLSTLSDTILHTNRYWLIVCKAYEIRPI